MPSFTTVPLTTFVTRSPSAITSSRVHAPHGLSTSCRPRKPSRSCQSASRPNQLMRRSSNSRASPRGSKTGSPSRSVPRPRGHARRELAALGVEAGHEDEVAHAALDDLRLDRPHPGAVPVRAGVAVRALAVDQDAAVPGGAPPLAPGGEAPAELHDQTVVAVRLAGDEAAPALAADPDRRGAVHLVHDGEDAQRVLAVRVHEPRVEGVERLPVEQPDRPIRADRGAGAEPSDESRSSRRRAAHQSLRSAWM